AGGRHWPVYADSEVAGLCRSVTKVDTFTDEGGPAVLLTQGEPVRDDEGLLVHPWQLAQVCRELGLANPHSTHDAAQATRRLHALRNRLQILCGPLEAMPDTLHPDLCRVKAQALALCDLADEFTLDHEATSADPEGRQRALFCFSNEGAEG
ncbi:MAG: hypothetical protein ACK5O3_00420, partial [Burkholderiales bacterium]